MAGWYGGPVCDACNVLGGTVDPACAATCGADGTCGNIFSGTAGIQTCWIAGYGADPDCNVCGDGVTDWTEACDGADVGGASCKSLGFPAGGALTCRPDCSGFDVSGCVMCGDGKIGLGEHCDGVNLGGETCQSLGFEGGTLACKSNCVLDTSACTTTQPYCGDGKADHGELCDGDDTRGVMCVNALYPTKLRCTPDCQGYDFHACHCGNGIRETGEVCDGDAWFDGKTTCADWHLGEGTPTCTEDCRPDFSTCERQDYCAESGWSGKGDTCDPCHLLGSPPDLDCATGCGPDGTCADVYSPIVGVRTCMAAGYGPDPDCGVCGDGTVDPGEVCDGDDAGLPSCRSFGFWAGQVSCKPDCSGYDSSACDVICGDGVRHSSEECEGTDLGDASCASYGFSGGTLACKPTCEHDVSGCTAPDAYHLSGTIRYERLKIACNKGEDQPCSPASCCYDPRPDGRPLMPARDVRVQLVDDGDPTYTVIADDFTDHSGRYDFRWVGPRRVRVIFWSETARPKQRVEDNTNGDSLYGIRSPFDASDALDAAVTSHHDITAWSSWDGAEWTGPRAAAPFAILDTAWGAAHAFAVARPDEAVFPMTPINWSIHNVPEAGDKSLGQIGHAHYSHGEREIYLPGADDIDVDEYDDVLITHEWTHGLDAALFRKDSPGGGHVLGHVKDMRLAWAEGLANGISAMLHHPGAILVNINGVDQASWGGYSLSDDPPSPDPSPGWFSECSVWAILYDLFDPYDPAEPLDTVQLGPTNQESLGILFDILSGPVANSDAFASLFSSIDALRSTTDKGPEVDAFLNSLYLDPAACNTESSGIDLVADAWGSTETHYGSWAPNLPDGGSGPTVYLDLEAGTDGFWISLRNENDSTNDLTQTRYARFVGNGGYMRVQTDCPDDRDASLGVYRRGVGIGILGTDNGDESIYFKTEAGAVYAVAVNGKHLADTEPYDCRLWLEAD